MLKIINDLKPFFEDCYRRIGVREYAEISKISPPTASKLLDHYHSNNLLLKTSYRKYIFFFADKDSKDFIDLSRLYWKHRLKELISMMESNLINPTIILFGSLSKGEAKPDSDVDLAIFSTKKDLNVKIFERRLGRKIQILWFDSLKDVKNRELTNNIINGYVLKGRLTV